MLPSSQRTRFISKGIDECCFSRLKQKEIAVKFLSRTSMCSLFSRGERFREEEGRRQIAEDRGPSDQHVREGRRGSDAQLPNNRRQEVRRDMAAQQQGNQAQQGLPVHQRG